MNKMAEGEKPAMDVVFCIDENYAMPCGVALYSLLRTNQDMRVNAHILGQGLSEASKSGLAQTAQTGGAAITFYEYASYGGGRGVLPIPKNTKLTEAVYIRLFIAHLLPRTVNKALFLDADVLVVDCLKELWKTDITDVPAAAVLDANCSNIHFFNRLEYDISYGYYNSGILLLNLTLWRNGEIARKCVDFALKNPEKCHCPDQDVINYCLRGKIKTLPF
ncbi:MAG: glycosyltransferase family 8 protein, partial [Spirochaetaceae bacterium]|nr:glycosyltransferase family 8 protein [Spirochaetaceae bacterium]